MNQHHIFLTWYIFLLFLVGLCGSQIGKIDSRCTTPDRKDGICINIKKCEPILDLLRNQRDKPGVIDFVRRDNNLTFTKLGFSLNEGSSNLKRERQMNWYPIQLSQTTRSGCGYDPSNPNIPLVCCPRSTQVYNNLLSPPNCGITKVLDHDKIVGGTPAELGAWPWLAALGYRTTRNPGPSWRCGGTLISNRYVVTAAHCTYPPGFTLFLVRLGELNFDSRVNDGATPFDVRIEKIINHEGYSAKKYINDIALLRLQQNVPFSDLIRPICLPKTKELIEKDFTGYSPFLAGWGATAYRGSSSQTLMEVQVEILEDRKCRDSYRGKANITRSQLCAGEDGKDACQGDSGGPMMWPKGPSSHFYLIGVVSFGINCADARYPGIYTRVTEYLNWLSTHMQ